MTITEKIPSKLELAPDIICRFIEKIKISSFCSDDIFKIKVSLEEALTNAMRHGNKLNSSLFVIVTLSIEKEKIVIKVQDEGDGFDFNKIPDPTKGAKALTPSGRGIYLMKSFMNEVIFSDLGRCVEMTKHLIQNDK